ncbi:hypothetical protein JVU11DRAFT_854 [Chiua virens]|nr:hypothetical protein JVU11DRAFT_854 [Chiua virens]
MTIQEPAWLKRTRPCPFFSQGRCLFADSCNFLHDVKVRSAVTQPSLTTVKVRQSALLPRPVLDPPSVVVDAASPRSDSLASPESSASSAYGSSRYSGLLSVLSDVIAPTSSVADTNADPEATLVDQFASQTEASLPEEEKLSAERVVSVPNDTEATDGNTASYPVDGTQAHAIGSDVEESDDDEATDDQREQDLTAMASNRHSTLSSFTGASLLASPRNGVFGESPTPSPIGDGATKLLSPVELSAKLRPFPIPSLTSKLKRGGSIDSGYADGDSWPSPLPFPRSPPRSFRSSVISLSHSRRASHSSLALKDRRVSYDVHAVRPSPYDPIDVIKEVDSGGTSEHGSEVNVDSPYTIFGAYHASPSEQQDENKARDSLQVNVTVETDKKVKEDDDQLPAIRRSPHRSSNDHLHPTEEHDLDLCNRASFVSDDNLSFRTALSAQPSYDNLSDISKVSPVKQDSLLSFVSGRSTPNTSILSHYSDANEPLEQPVVCTRVRESYLVTTTDLASHNDSTGVSETRASEERSFPKEVTPDSDTPFASVYPDNLQRLPAVKVVFPRRPLSGASRVRRSLTANSPSDDSRNLPSATSSLSCIPLDIDGVCVPEDVNDTQEFSLGIVSALRECSPSILPYTRDTPNSSPSTSVSSCEDTRSCALADQECDAENVVSPQQPSLEVLCPDEPSSKLSPSAESSSVNDDFDSAAQDLSGTFHFDEHGPEFALSGASEVQKFTPQEAFPNHPCSDSNDDISGGPLPLLASSHSRLQSPEIGVSLGSDEITGSFDSESNSLKQRLSFPPRLPVEFVQRPALPGDNACRMSQHEVHHSGFDLTEKARPSQLPIVESPNSDTDSTLRRHRATSDLTMKGKSPLLAVPEDISHISKSPPPHTQEVHPQPLYCAPHTFQRETSPVSDSTFARDSPQSDTVFRPLLTGRRSFLRSSLAEVVPRTNPTVIERSSPTQSSNRLQARVIGSTVVPLGFRRHRLQSATTQSLRSVSQPLQSVLPASELREALRIRTDVARDLPLECSSASHVSFIDRTRSPLPVQSMSAPPTGGLRQLHLTSIVNRRSSTLSTQSSSITSSIVSNHILNTPSLQSPSVSSTTSLSHSSSLHSSSCEQIPEHINHTLKRCSSDSLIPQVTDDAHFPPQCLATPRNSRSLYAPIQQTNSWRLSHYRAGSRNYTSADGSRRASSRTSTLSLSYIVDEEQEIDDGPATSPPTMSSHTDGWTGSASVHTPPAHAIATPKPSLLFAIASDDVEQVRRVLENGEAGPNDSVGPQSALAFTLTNHRLAHKQEIVKALLAYGANPSALQNPTLNPAPRIQGSNEPSGPPLETTLEGMDPATRYFVARADAAHTRQTSQLIYRSFFRPLTRVRYDVIGQDWALEQLFRVLSMHSQKLAVAPIVVLLCGPSGHGKSLLARKFGSLLDVPTHTVNMTTLRSTHDIWQSYSMSPYEEPSSYTLAEFLTENEGKRCVVVLDEIEKVEDQKALWSLLIPWELGRCSLEAGKRHVDTRNVIWLGTSNIGHELVFEHHEDRAAPDKRMSREEYLELTDMLRPRVSHCLGASLVSRVTTVLPFVPFTLDEKKAITAEAVYALAGDASKTLSPQDVESLVMKALPSYQPSDGARSLHRAISNILINRL